MNYEIKQEIASHIIDGINDGRLIGLDANDIHNELFNTDYYIIGTWKAEQFLIRCGGVFECINEVANYELDNYGEVLSNEINAEKIANMIAYIYGEELLYSLDCWNDLYDVNELTEKHLKKLKKELNEVLK